MSQQKSSTDRAVLRQTLLANGYTPLPLRSKGIYIKGWSIADVDEHWLAAFDRVADYPNTGLRCDRLSAFDIDVMDERLALECEQVIESKLGKTEFCRFGEYPKRLLLYRLEGEPGSSARTGKYGDHRIELLTGAGRQFAAYGRHPSGVDYTWDSEEPLTTPLQDLPPTTIDAAAAVMDELEALLEGTGLQKRRLAHAHHIAEDNEAFDLTEDFPILLDTGEELTWGALKDTLDKKGVFGNIKREDGEFGDSNGVHFLIAENSEMPFAYDFVRDVKHWEPAVDPRKLGQVLSNQPSGQQMLPAGVNMFTPTFMQELLTRWVIVAEDSTVRHVNKPLDGIPIHGFTLTRQHRTVQAGQNAQGQPKTEPAVKVWLKDPTALRADKCELLPYTTEILVHNGDVDVFNTYRPPRLPTEGGEIKTVHEFIEHLIPKEEERELFWDWHALKVAHPEYRMHGLVMVTQAYGTGRGTWVQILQRLFGSRYVLELPLSDLVGSGSQAAFNAYLADSLIVAVPEALEEREDASPWKARQMAYERLKTIVQPQAGEMHIKRKYGRNSVSMVYASLLITTNHVDAIAVQEGDRRLIVLDNTPTPLTNAPWGLCRRIHEWKNAPANIGALHRALLSRAQNVAYDPFGEPMMSAAKELMVEHGKGDIDQAFDWVVANAPGELIVQQQWERWALKAKLSAGLNWEQCSKTDQVIAAVLRKRGKLVNPSKPRWQIRVQGLPVRPRILRNAERWIGCQNNHALVEEVLKNGELKGKVLPMPQKKD